MLKNLERGAAGEDLKGWEGDAGPEETWSWQPRCCQVKKCHVQQEGTRMRQGGHGHSPGGLLISSMGLAGWLWQSLLQVQSWSVTWTGRTGYLQDALPGPSGAQGAATAWQRNNWIFPQPKNSDINIVHTLIITVTRVECGKKLINVRHVQIT